MISCINWSATVWHSSKSRFSKYQCKSWKIKTGRLAQKQLLALINFFIFKGLKTKITLCRRMIVSVFWPLSRVQTRRALMRTPALQPWSKQDFHCSYTVWLTNLYCFPLHMDIHSSIGVWSHIDPARKTDRNKQLEKLPRVDNISSLGWGGGGAGRKHRKFSFYNPLHS